MGVAFRKASKRFDVAKFLRVEGILFAMARTNGFPKFVLVGGHLRMACCFRNVLPPLLCEIDVVSMTVSDVPTSRTAAHGPRSYLQNGGRRDPQSVGRAGMALRRLQNLRNTAVLLTGTFLVTASPPHDAEASAAQEAAPRLRQVRFTGAELPVPRHELLDQLAAAGLDALALPRVSEEDARRAARLLEQILEDYRVTADLERRRDEGVDLVLHLERKRLPHIAELLFTGNQALSTEELRGVMKLGPSGVTTFFNHRDQLAAAQLQRDLESIRSLYRRRGFFEAEAGPARIEALAPGKVRLEIPVREGEVFSWGKLTVDPVSVLTEEELRSALEHPSGSPYDAEAVRESVRVLERRLQDRGYPAPRIELSERADPVLHTVDLGARLEPGPTCLVGRIEFRGHRSISDPQLRQYLSLQEGDLFRMSAVEKSVAQLGSLGYFRRVLPSLALRPGQGRADVVFEMEEAPRFDYFLGGSASGREGAAANFTLRVRSPWGWGDTWQGSGNLGNRLQDGTLLYDNPFFPGRRLAVSAAFASQRLEYPDETIDNETSLWLGLAGPRGSRRVFQVGFGYVKFRLGSDLEGTVPFLTEFLGKTFDTGRLRLGIGFDGRDRPLFATRGTLALARVDLAGGPLGGDLSLLRVRLRASRVSPLDPRRHHLLALTGWWERVRPYSDTLQEGLPRFERLFLGGEQDLRGFPVRGVGPLSPEGVVVGGDQLAYFSVEYDYAPVHWLRWAGFVDAGNAWASDYAGSPLPRVRYDAGSEIQLQAPFFGLPLRAGYAVNLNPIAGESRGRFFFALSARF